MNKTIKILEQSKWFLIPYAIVWGVMLIFALKYDRIDGHIMLNMHHTPYLDTFFKYTTYIGAGIPTAVGIIMLAFSTRKAILILGAQLLNLVLTQIPKFIINAPRPIELFSQNNLDLPAIVEGVALHTSRSFPSGHTSAAFALCFAITLLIPHKYRYLNLVTCVTGIICAYSRVYLSQHFLMDTLAGSIIGIVSASIIYSYTHMRNEWGEMPIWNFIKTR